ncbi:hypothetical protein ACLOJK_018639 [Asimina triloba]
MEQKGDDFFRRPEVHPLALSHPGHYRAVHTKRDHRDDNICLNEWMFKRKRNIDRHFWVSLLSKKVILECVTFAEKRNTKIVSNLPDSVLEWKSRFFYSHFRKKGGTGVCTFAGKWNTKIVSNLPDSMSK